MPDKMTLPNGYSIPDDRILPTILTRQNNETRKMTILFTFYYPLPHTGGIWTFVTQLKKRLEMAGHHVDVLALHPNATHYYLVDNHEKESQPYFFQSYIKESIDRENPVLHLNSWIYYAELTRYSLELTALAYGLEEYDVIYAQDAISAVAMSRVKPNNTPLITSTHGHLSGEIYYELKKQHPQLSDRDIKSMFEYQYFHQLETIGLQSSNIVHTQSKWMRNLIVETLEVLPSRIITFPYGIDVEAFHERSDSNLPPSISKETGKKVILFTGRLEEVKGVSYLLSALFKLKSVRQDWVCWIVGDGSLRQTLQLQCKSLDLEKEVQFLGEMNHVASIMQLADVFVLPGLQDTQPHAVMEAQLSGLPVIVTDAAGLPEMVVNDVNGFIVPVKCSQTLSDRIQLLLDSDDLRNRFSSQAKSWAASQWSLTNMVDRFVTLFYRVLKK